MRPGEGAGAAFRAIGGLRRRARLDQRAGRCEGADVQDRKCPAREARGLATATPVWMAVRNPCNAEIFHLLSARYMIPRSDETNGEDTEVTVRNHTMVRLLPYSFEVWYEDEAWHLCVMDRDYRCMWITPLKREPSRETLQRITWNRDMSREGHRAGGKQGWMYDPWPPWESEVAWSDHIARLNVLLSLEADVDRAERRHAGYDHLWSHRAWHEHLGLALRR